MNFLRRLWQRFMQSSQPPAASPPPWAKFFSPPQYQRFLQLIQEHFRERRIKFTLGDGVIHLEQPLGGGQQLGLLNLAQNCAHNEERDWPDIVQSHFRIMEKSHQEHEVLQERLTNFDRVAELLSVRLWPESYLRELGGGKILYRRDVPGTITALVFDLPSSVRNVTPEESDAWGKSEKELFDIGLANL